MKNKLFLVIAPIVALIFLYFVSQPTLLSLLKMLPKHKGDPEISDEVRYFVTAQYMLTAFFVPTICLMAFLGQAIKIGKSYFGKNSNPLKRDMGNPYAPPALEPSRLLRDLPSDERKKLILAGDTTAGPLTVFMYRNPIGFALISILATSAFFYGCWTCIQM